MLHSVKELKGLKIAATDGEIGTIHDVYFDDAHWTIRYLIVDTGGWISGRRVLISPHAITEFDWAGEALHANLTKQQIKDSPSTDTTKPVSRQHEAEIHDHYGYPYYWGGPFLWGAVLAPTMGAMPSLYSSEQQDDDTRPEPELSRANLDPNLRSGNEVIGYKIQATDDTIGHVEDFMFDDKDWSIQLMAIDTAHWWPGKSVLVSPQRIKDVSWSDNMVNIDLSREEVENSMEYDPANLPPFGPKFDLYRRFGMPHM